MSVGTSGLKHLALPDGSRTALFNLFVQKLRVNPVLKGAGVKVIAWEGDAADARPPSTSETPWVRVTPALEDPQIAAVGLQAGDVLFGIEIAVQGYNPRDFLNLWDAVEKALFPGDGSMQAALQRIPNALGTLWLRTFAFGEDKADDAGPIWSGKAVLGATLTIPVGL